MLRGKGEQHGAQRKAFYNSLCKDYNNKKFSETRIPVQREGEMMEYVMSEEKRNRAGRRASLTGAAVNLGLFAGKLSVGLLSGALSVVADAFNNLSDAANCLIGLIGFLLAGRPADEEHPYGHARYEYMAALAVSAVVLIVGADLLHNAVERIRNPEELRWSPVLIMALCLSVAVKLLLALYDRRQGNKLKSDVLRAAAMDSVSDALATSAVLAGTCIQHITGFHTDGWLSAGIAVLILWGAVTLTKNTISPLLGKAPSPEEVRRLQKRILSYPSVAGMHDLMIHDYGPGHRFASAHVEMPAEMSQIESHEIIDRIEQDVLKGEGIHLVIHCDPVVLDDPRLPGIQSALREITGNIDRRITVHDLRIVPGEKCPKVIFDCVVPYEYKEENALKERISAAFWMRFGEDYQCVATVEHSYTGSAESACPPADEVL